MVTTCPYCGVGCQLELWIKDDKIAKVKGADSVPNFGATCVKGRFGLDFVQRPDRLTKPLIRKDGKLVESTWDEALDLVAAKLGAIKKEHGPAALAGLSSAKCTNEENFVFQKFVRTAFGSNNVDHCARLCHASTVAGLARSFGSGAMTNSIEELEHAEVILVTGSNTTETHPVIATRIKKAVLFHGAKLIVIDPRQIDLVKYTEKYGGMWLRQKNGSDVAWANGMMNVDHQRRAARRGIRQDAHRGLRGPEKSRLRLHPGKSGEDHRHSRRAAAGGGPLVRQGQERLHRLFHGHHPAHHRHRQRHVHGQPGHAHRQPGQGVGGRQSAARPEQRAGLLRHGRPAQRLPRLPGRDRRRPPARSSRRPGTSSWTTRSA